MKKNPNPDPTFSLEYLRALAAEIAHETIRIADKTPDPIVYVRIGGAQ
jgi:hypothetical protein